MKSENVKATIVSKPTAVIFTCPHCQEKVEVTFSAVNFASDYWWDGASVDCPECSKEVYLDDFEYD